MTLSREGPRSHVLGNPLSNDAGHLPTQGGVSIRDACQAGSLHSSHDEPGRIVLTADPEALPDCEEPTA